MAEDITHPGHNPFDPPRQKRNMGMIVALVVAFIVHALLGIYFWKTKFHMEYKEYSEDVTDVAMIKPAPPPPPPRKSVV